MRLDSSLSKEVNAKKIFEIRPFFSFCSKKSKRRLIRLEVGLRTGETPLPSREDWGVFQTCGGPRRSTLLDRSKCTLGIWRRWRMRRTRSLGNMECRVGSLKKLYRCALSLFPSWTILRSAKNYFISLVSTCLFKRIFKNNFRISKIYKVLRVIVYWIVYF